MSTPYRLMHFLRTYKQLGIALLSLVAALALELGGWRTAAHWLLGAVSAVATLPMLRDMWRELRTGKYGIDILAATAVVTSVALGEFWAGIVIVVMFTGGQALEDYAGARAKTELDALLSRAPQKAIIIRGRKQVTVRVSEIRVNDTVLIKPGDVVPVDAVIIEGSAEFDESNLTGESLPQPKHEGDELLSGSIAMNEAVTARCLRDAEDSQYEQIIKLVRTAAASQAPVVRLADRYSIPFTAISYLVAIGAWILGHQAIRFLEVIVVATPCPLLLAAPIAVISGMSRAAKHGIIVKTGAALEQLAEAQTIAFDKTGTLTSGSFKVERVVTFATIKKQKLLATAASLEQQSNHILAKAIVEAAVQAKVKIPRPKRIAETAGQGVSAQVDGKPVLVGRLDFIASHGVILPKKSATKASQTATYVAIDGVLAGMITFSDTARDESKQTITTLRRLGVQNIMMFTGDNEAAAKAIGRELGIRDVRAHMLPADKLRAVEAIANRPVAFVGDGVNDAPVLTASDIGIALGARGSTAASESADMVIMLDDLSRVATAVSIAKHTFAIARQSILIGIGLSIALMLIFATGHFPPLAGALLQEAVDVLVIFNALRAHSVIAGKADVTT